MYLSQSKEVISHCILNNINPLIVGPQGIGKSETIEQIASKLIGRNVNVTEEYTSDNVGFSLYHPSMGQPCDVMGLPFKTGEDRADFLPIGFMTTLFNATSLTICFIDEIGQASSLMQSVVMGLIQSRRINNRPISPFVRFVLATNRVSDNAGVKNILDPLKGRCIIINIEVNTQEWCEWAFTNGISKEIIYYIHAFPDELSESKTTRDISNIRTPRNWTRLHSFVHAGMVSHEIIAGCIGEEAATKFYGFYRNYQDFAGIVKEIRENPQSARMFNEPDKIYALGLCLAQTVEKKYLSAYLAYMQRYSNMELFEFTISFMTKLHPELKETREYIDFMINRK
jgi:hypothetical protein